MPHSKDNRGYTLVEVLVALTLTLILLTAVVKVFSGVGDGISKSKKTLEEFDRLRLAESVLRQDLQGITVSMSPPWRPEEAKGYFEYIEGGPNNPPAYILDPNDPRYNQGNTVDNTVGELSDVVMFTTRSITRPFTGRFDNSIVNPSGVTTSNGQTMQSDVAEVAWFLRGHTLHRRVLLVAPGLASNTTFQSYSPSTFYANNDISVHVSNGKFVPNTLSDLARRENRYAHPTGTFPFDVRSQWGLLGLPTMRECADTGFMSKYSWTSGSFPNVPSYVGTLQQTYQKVDPWQSFCYDSVAGKDYWAPDWWLNLNQNTATKTAQPTQAQSTPRDADDIILTNVIGFDVKAWDPVAQAYVDLGTGNGVFSNAGAPLSSLTRVYDTYPQSYESEGTYYFSSGKQTQITTGGVSNNGFDDHQSGMVDGPQDQITSPPYPVALRGIQIKIRVFESSSRQVREATIEHDFLPK
jgi:prepilin-type N-terminal cleavage/methylation domain-containing protein